MSTCNAKLVQHSDDVERVYGNDVYNPTKWRTRYFAAKYIHVDVGKKKTPLCCSDVYDTIFEN